MDIFGNNEGIFNFNDTDNMEDTNVTKIKIIGVGGGGCNAVKRMITQNLEGADFIVANTDAQSLKSVSGDRAQRIQIGVNISNGLGAGAKPEVGRKAALEERDQLQAVLKGADMVFVTAGMGGGTGTGASPVIAGIAKELGILTVGVVTKPFAFEGKQRMRRAIDGIKELKENVDSLIVIPNEKLSGITDMSTTLNEAFIFVDDVLRKGVQGISDLIVKEGLINVDFADVQTIMKNKGDAIMGIGYGEGENRAIDAAKSAINSHILEISIAGATGILVNITASSSLKLKEVNEAVNLIKQEADPEVNVIVGTCLDEDLKDRIQISIIATGFDEKFSNIGREKARVNVNETPQIKTQQRRAGWNPMGGLDFNIRSGQDLETPTINSYSNNY
jgi:cell division protein FtsZ